MLTRTEEIMRDVCDDFEAELKEFDGEQDHVHLLVYYPPKVQLSKLVNSLKGVSSRRLRQEYDSHVRRYLWGGHFWSGSYFAGSCGGAPLSVVKQYIENQQPHLTATTEAQSPLALRTSGPRMAFTPALKGGAPAKIRGRSPR